MSTRLSPFLLLCCFGVSFVGCSKAPYPCAADSDCPAFGVCSQGNCVAKPCANTSEGPVGAVCSSEGGCQEATCQQGGCGPGQEWLEGVCRASTCDPACNVLQECVAS